MVKGACSRTDPHHRVPSVHGLDMRIGLVLPAAGRGLRLATSVPKQFLRLGSKAIFCHTINAFAGLQQLENIILLVPEDLIETATLEVEQQVCPLLKDKVRIMAGCETRHRTIGRGVAELDRHKIQVTIIHDAVRPLVSLSFLQQLIAAAIKYGAAGPVTKLTSTVVSRDENGFLDQVLTRSQYFDSQMPQVFQHEVICEAYCNCSAFDLDNGTECLDLVRRYSSPKFGIKLIEGDPNVLWKVTHRKDLMLTGLALHDSDMAASHVMLHSETCDDLRSDRLCIVQKVEECVNTFCETISSTSCTDLRGSLHAEESATLTCVCLRFCSCMEEFASQVRELESWSESCRSLLLIIVFEGNQEHGSCLTPFFCELEKVTAGSTAVLYFLDRSQPKAQQVTKRDAFHNLIQLILLKPKVFSGQVLFV